MTTWLSELNEHEYQIPCLCLRSISGAAHAQKYPGAAHVGPLIRVAVMVWWVLVWDRFCSVSDKESLDILETAESPKLFLQNLDRTFMEERGQGIVLA